MESRRRGNEMGDFPQPARPGPHPGRLRECPHPRILSSGYMNYTFCIVARTAPERMV
ncbi:hypothetical protein MTBUT4_70092 [Magnetospirillum sp. UT-4]|nr:hypothetical protein MTBUT4_70092 [Magnetospirillum sp. UT-4]